MSDQHYWEVNTIMLLLYSYFTINIKCVLKIVLIYCE